MLKRYLEQRHINLEHGRNCLALKKVYWDAIESLANPTAPNKIISVSACDKELPPDAMKVGQMHFVPLPLP